MPELDNRGYFERLILRSIDARIEDILKEEAEKAAEIVKRRVKELAPLVISNLTRRMHIEMPFKEQMIITIDLKDNTKQ